jgi:hypothetical protein
MLLVTAAGLIDISQLPNQRGTGMLTVRIRGDTELESLRNTYLPSLKQIEPDHALGFRYRATAPAVELATMFCRLLGEVTETQTDTILRRRFGDHVGMAYRTLLGGLLDALDNVPALLPQQPAPVRRPHASTPWHGLPYYGGIVFRADGHILLRRPPGNAGEVGWTFFFGKVNHGEVPKGAVRRLARSLLGVEARANELINGEFWWSNSRAVYYVMDLDECCAEFDERYTAELQWTSVPDARTLIEATADWFLRRHNLAVLEAAAEVWAGRNHSKSPQSWLQ